MILVNGTKSSIAWGNIPLWDLAKCINCTNDQSNGILNFSLFSLEENITVSTRFHGDIIPWNINSDTVLPSNNESNISISWSIEPNNDAFLMAWLDFNSNNIEIHLAAWSGVY